jgi:hypothetical protein
VQVITPEVVVEKNFDARQVAQPFAVVLYVAHPVTVVTAVQEFPPAVP